MQRPFLVRHAMWAVLGIGVLVFVLGGVAFALSLRPCRLAFNPGDLLSYSLTTTTAEILPGGGNGPERQEERRLDLVCVGGDNEVALVLPRADGRADEIVLIGFSPEGQALLLDADGRPQAAGRAVGFFDFNLLPLPSGIDDEWEVPLTYATLPPGKRNLAGKVKRIRRGSAPEFQLRLPSSIEWVQDGRYLQVRDLVCTYRFDTIRGLVERAEIKLTAGVEQTQARRYRVTVNLALVRKGSSGDDPAHLRQLAVAAMRTTSALSQGQGDLGSLRERLGTTVARSGDTPLRAAALDVLRRSEHPPAAHWRVSVAAVEPARRPAAEGTVRRLAAAGLPARLVARQGRLAIELGPYAEQDPTIIASVEKLCPGAKPRWIQGD